MRQQIRISLLLFLTFPILIEAQNNNSEPCYSIEFLDFFGATNIQKTAIWTNDEIIQLSKQIAETPYGPTKSPIFLIPVIMAQLPHYHPKCTTNIDTSALNNLTRLYASLSNAALDSLINFDKDTQIDAIRYNFYQLVKNDSLLPMMLFTMDDGPFFGKDLPDSTLLINPDHSIFLPSGSLFVYEQPDQVCIEFKGPNENIRWRKILTEFGENIYLRDLFIPDDVVSTNSLATIVSIYLNHEELSLYLRNTGEFMFYFYSW